MTVAELASVALRPDERMGIGDHAMLSDGRLAALVACDGSIDWLCLPEPHGPAVFWSLLDASAGGFWRIHALDTRRTERRYLPGTLSVETTFRCGGGVMRLTDECQVLDDTILTPDFELTRTIECVEGEVDVRCEFVPRPDFGRRRARLHAVGARGLRADARRTDLLLLSELPLEVRRADGAAVAGARLARGDVRRVGLGFTRDGPSVWPSVGDTAARRSAATRGWWRSWLEGHALPDFRRVAVERSLLTLKALTYPPTGAVVAAPTTSLPESPGGTRNWDYRYCWVRDAALIMRAMLNLGVRNDATAFFSWLLSATRLTRPGMRVLYDVYGRPGVAERELEHVAGYRGSRPVRVGNAAGRQLQLDTYGALLEAAWRYHREGGRLSRSAGRMLRGFVGFACDNWERPDHGIWEIRSDPRHHTLSKAMCWVAMDRGLRLAGEGIFRLDEERIRRSMRVLREVIRRDGFNARLGTYVGTFGGDTVDASLLLLSLYGFEEADSQRMQGTIDCVYERLGRDGALYRYRGTEDGVGGVEGRFGICGFWGVEALVGAGRLGEAHAAFDSLMSHSNDVGLFAEEIDVQSGQALGNFPQALTHVGVINAATTLAHAERGESIRAETGGMR